MKSELTFYFEDGSTAIDNEMSWRAISEERLIEDKMFLVCTKSIEKIKISTETEVLLLNVSDRKLFYFISSQSEFCPTGEVKTTDIGKTVGFIEDDKVVEEYFIDERTNEIKGIKK
jgi:hypothetical protein